MCQPARVTRSVRIIGRGRAGGALGRALEATGRWTVAGSLGRQDDVTGAAAGVELLVVATPDAVVAEVAAAVEPVPTTVVAHLAGSLGLGALAPHARRAVLHPLASLPDTEVGARRLRQAWWGLAVGGDPIDAEVVADLEGHVVRVADADRARYHAAAVIAANHVVALLGQVERVAASIGIPLQAFLALTRGAVDNVEQLGAAGALTGPVKRGDEATLARHRAALPADELDGYDAMVREARKLC
jgi:predicted short-subunit dehydrogenase-like oxidoreductase (DUF2520 family)